MKKTTSLFVLTSLALSSTAAFANSIELDDANARCKAHVVLTADGESRNLKVNNSKCDEIVLIRPGAPAKKYKLTIGMQSFNVTWMESRLEIRLDGQKIILLGKSGGYVEAAAKAQYEDLSRKRQQEIDEENAAKVVIGATAAVLAAEALEEAASTGEK